MLSIRLIASENVQHGNSHFPAQSGSLWSDFGGNIFCLTRQVAVTVKRLITTFLWIRWLVLSYPRDSRVTLLVRISQDTSSMASVLLHVLSLFMDGCSVLWPRLIFKFLETIFLHLVSVPVREQEF